ncbi:hypothetical protein MAR_022663 [Mya arenaria]|uniref:Mitochondria-eating protein C-terminal domain-containing protein n=1 Tax=Mya arenaria TaxID=6604 RepID=A0ABY7DPK0_MYAAR|nr:hypothetical protein MAR_022663 [Mya arenaria]
MGNNGSSRVANVPKTGNKTRNYKRGLEREADDLLNQFEEQITFWQKKIVKIRGQFDTTTKEDIIKYVYTQMKVAADDLLQKIPPDFQERSVTSTQDVVFQNESFQSTYNDQPPTLKRQTNTESGYVNIGQDIAITELPNSASIDDNASLEYMASEKETSDAYNNVFEFCEKKAKQMLKKTDDAVNLLFDEYRKSADVPVHLTMSRKQLAKYCKEQSTIEDMQLQKRWEPSRQSYVDKNEPENDKEAESKHVKVEEQMTKVRKEVSHSILPIVQRAYMEASWRKQCVHGLKPFILQCLYVGWMMVVQSPPMCFKTALRGDKFDSNSFKQYTCTGSIVDFVVWPALMLHQCGPVVGKGVAQPEKHQ